MATERTALVTGAASGIGRATAAAFRAAGYKVIAADIAVGDGITVLDVRDPASIAAVAGKLDSLHALFNAAGIIRRREEYDPAVFAEVIDVNLTGVMRLSVACKPALAKGKGAVINIASLYAFDGAPHAPGYAASKGAIAQLTKSLAIDWAKDGIRVNAIAPGWVETPLSAGARSDPARNKAIIDRVPMGRWAKPEEIADPAVFLASDAARFITGAVIPVDGGYTAV
jgi:NAD(P)-dependent dehydrogenase (short-subunit alcohol dehydrogenase family)